MTNQEYKDIFQQYDLEKLRGLWKIIREGGTPDRMEKGKAFEFMIMRLFELDNASVTYSYSVVDSSPDSNSLPIEEIDGLFYYQHYIGMVECKNYTSYEGKRPRNVDFTPIAKLRSQLLRRPVTAIGNVFSATGFTSPAVALATHLHPQTILLWNKDDVDYVIDKGRICPYFIKKYRQYVVDCTPDYDLKKIQDEINKNE
jgi:hypothetical protein